MATWTQDKLAAVGEVEELGIAGVRPNTRRCEG